MTLCALTHARTQWFNVFSADGGRKGEVRA